ncbi:MAG: enoyl-CoA hydratase/isomerase family protein [Pseudomonadota bacterium]
MTDTNVVLVERHEGWAEIVINRPERRNSIIPPVSHAMRAALVELEKDDSVACVLIRGEGGFFCSGIDLKALQADPPPPWKNEQGNSWRDLHLQLFHFTKPVIGAFEKYGINAGAALGLACDILIAGETAFLQVGEIQQGAMAPMNMAWFRIKSTEQVMARLTLYGDRVPGPELVRLGLATECVADDAVLARSREIAARIAGFPPGAGTNIKQSIINQRGIENPDDFFKQPKSNALLSAAMVKD